MPDQDPTSPVKKPPPNLHFLVNRARVLHVKTSESVVKDILRVGVLQFLSHEGKESSEVDLSRAHFAHFSAEFVVLHNS